MKMLLVAFAILSILYIWVNHTEIHSILAILKHASVETCLDQVSPTSTYPVLGDALSQASLVHACTYTDRAKKLTDDGCDKEKTVGTMQRKLSYACQWNVMTMDTINVNHCEITVNWLFDETCGISHSNIPNSKNWRNYFSWQLWTKTGWDWLKALVCGIKTFWLSIAVCINAIRVEAPIFDLIKVALGIGTLVYMIITLLRMSLHCKHLFRVLKAVLVWVCAISMQQPSSAGVMLITGISFSGTALCYVLPKVLTIIYNIPYALFYIAMRYIIPMAQRLLTHNEDENATVRCIRLTAVDEQTIVQPGYFYCTIVCVLIIVCIVHQLTVHLHNRYIQ